MVMVTPGFEKIPSSDSNLFCGRKNLCAGGVKALPTPTTGINQAAYGRPSYPYDPTRCRANQIGTCLHNWREIWPFCGRLLTKGRLGSGG
jgi:hypothetical protein